MAQLQPYTLTDEEFSALEAKVREEQRLDFRGRYASAHDWKEQLSIVRAAYAYHMSSIMNAARNGHIIDSNIVWKFSPIEDTAWCQLKALGLPFYPQFPILEYFADFADPLRKVVIELDGRQFHDRDKDMVRDKKMRDAGWTIYRISGSVAHRYLQDVFSEDLANEIEETINDEYAFSEEGNYHLSLAETTLDGFLLIVRRRHYGGMEY